MGKMKKCFAILLFILIVCCACEARPQEEATTEITTEATTEAPKAFTKKDAVHLSAGSVLTEEELDRIDDVKQFFYASKIDDETFARMKGKSYRKGCVMDREDLRYVRVLHVDGEGHTRIGELVCNKALAKDFVEIFTELYENNYEIEKMMLVDEYDGDDDASMEDNNTSCFNFRPVPGSNHLSQHAYGRAIDINPLYNPYVTSRGYMPDNAGDYVDRSKDIPYKIDREDLCYKVFTEHGFVWGGNWNSEKDYQHFQKKQ